MPDAEVPFLTTARLEFRSWRPGDLELAMTLWGDPAVTRFIDARDALPPDAVRARLAEEIALEREHAVQYWPLFARPRGDGQGGDGAAAENSPLRPGVFVGCCGLHPHDREAGVFELGCHVRSALWGRGLATEACRGVIGYAFESLGATALFAGHNPGNRASRRLLARLGFRYTHAELYPPTGLRHPSYLLERKA